MGPKRRTPVARRKGPPRRATTKNGAQDDEEIPQIYREMLADVSRDSPNTLGPHKKTVKRRKRLDGSAKVTANEAASPVSSFEDSVYEKHQVDDEAPQPHRQLQTVFDDFSSTEDDTDAEFEDVDLEVESSTRKDPSTSTEPLQIDLNPSSEQQRRPILQRRKPATPEERKMRLDAHKLHLLCLLGHLQRRNNWCNNEKVQTALKKLIPRKWINLLHLDASQPQFQRSHSFAIAVQEISKIWRGSFQVSGRGMRRAHWTEEQIDLEDVDSLPELVDLPFFIDSASTHEGSRDEGAQLFCALLRACAVDTRLVSSLQPLPFSGVAKMSSPEKPKSQYAKIYSLDSQCQRGTDSDSTILGHRQQNIGSLAFNGDKSLQSSRTQRKKVKESPYPIVWVEVLDEAGQKWIPVDSMVRGTFNKPKTGFEPAANDAGNSMSYVVAFEDDGSAIDVTRRYVESYNSKTRRNRIESTKGGTLWWKHVMHFYQKPFLEDRDDIEAAQLLAREENEPMPRNIQAFKNHPQYALERHLRRNQVIHPRREVGKVPIGLVKEGKLEPVFRRRDVLIVRTADQWYRLGRDVKVGEQALKRAQPVKRRNNSVGPDDQEAEEGALMYAEFQTELYVPPSALDGRVPRNAYGNLDVYVQGMIPAGTIHVQHPDAARAAKILGIDFADAVTGFKFTGRQGTAVLNGVVVATEYRDAIVAVVEGITYERMRENSEKRSAAAIQAWKRFYIALRIRERTHAAYAAKETGANEEDGGSDEDQLYEEEDEDMEGAGDGGGFFPETVPDYSARQIRSTTDAKVENDDLAMVTTSIEPEIPIIVHDSIHKMPGDESPADVEFDIGEGGFLVEESQENQVTQAAIPSIPRPQSQPMPKETTPSFTDTGHLMSVEESPTLAAELSNFQQTLPQPSTPTLSISDPVRQPSSSSSSLSKGSLLSHDPEDEDAEPEWAIDIVGNGRS